MKRAFLITSLLLLALPVIAQNRFSNTITSQVHDPNYQWGKDIWFAPIQNYYAQSDKYIAIYVTSKRKTTVYVQEGSTGPTLPPLIAQPNYVSTFIVPLGWEMQTSGIVENKAIHVWSKDAPIDAYMMSHSPSTSDGTHLIPTTGWGTDYIAAGYAALDAGAASGDEPSEFVVVASQDNTSVLITPSCDLRTNTSGAIAEHQAGQSFGLSLNRGDAVQFKSTSGGSVLQEDVTGTIIHSNVPVGVVAGSQCPFIPVTNGYCDHVCEMMPPVRSWGKTYYSVPFANRKNGDSFAVLASTNNQTIYRTVANVKSTYAIVNAGVPYWNDAITGASKWESDKPFLLVQYINSSTHDGPGVSSPDPAEVVINPFEGFANTVTFQAPAKQGGQTPYTHYLSLVVNKNAEASTTISGPGILGTTSLSKYTPATVDGIYDAYTISKINGSALAPGTYTVKSDSGIGVSIYGYGSYESYAWSSASGLGIPNSSDTSAPVATISGSCSQEHVALKDSGPFATKIASMQVDSVNNMDWVPASNWIEGIGMDSTFYDVSVIDPSQAAYIQVSVYDFAGNRRTVTNIYQPISASLNRSMIDFGDGNIGGPPVIQFDTLINTGALPLVIKTIRLQLGNQGFAIENPDTTSLKVGERRAIKISFVPLASNAVSDTLIVSDGCNEYTTAIAGSGGAPDFYASNQEWIHVPIGDTSLKIATVHNISNTSDIHITAITWRDTVHFSLVSGQLPVLLPHSGVAQVWFSFKPTSDSTVSTIVSWSSPDVLDNAGFPAVRQSTLTGSGFVVMGVNTPTKTGQSAFLYFDGGSLRMVLPNGWLSGQLEIENILGHRILTKEVTSNEPLEMPSLAHGVYFYRLRNDNQIASGSLVW